MDQTSSPQAAAIFVCLSHLDLELVCRHLQDQYALPDFFFEEHSRWTYARALGQQIGFNVTKTERFDDIARWMSGSPHNVNYQIVLYCNHTGATPADTTSWLSLTIREVRTFLNEVFQTDVLWIGPQAA